MQLNRTYFLFFSFLLVIAFSIGYMKGRYDSNRKWQILNTKIEQQYNKKLLFTLENNQKLLSSYKDINQKLLLTREVKNANIYKNESIIDSNNRITREFVQYFQNESRDRLQQDYSARAVSSIAYVPATEFLIWALGLQVHDRQCINQLNSLINAVKNSH